MSRNIGWVEAGVVGLSEAYANWAHERASLNGHPWSVVRGDIEASRKDFVAEAGEGTNEKRISRLWVNYSSSYEVCRTLAGLPEYVVIGG